MTFFRFFLGGVCTVILGVWLSCHGLTVLGMQQNFMARILGNDLELNVMAFGGMGWSVMAWDSRTVRVILLMHAFNISPTKTLDFNYTAYEGLDKGTKGNSESSSFLYTLPCVKKHRSAPCEAQTHDLQIMRLTRCLTAPTRHVLRLGWAVNH